MNPTLIIDASFLAAAFLFIYGLKRMSSPVTAASGIRVASRLRLLSQGKRAEEAGMISLTTKTRA